MNEAFRALRAGTAFSLDDGVHLRISGDEAFELLDRALPSSLFLRDGQLRQSLLLDDRGVPFADVLVSRADEDYLLWIEGPDTERSLAHLKAAGADTFDVDIDDLTPGYGVLTLHGPYAWELVAQVLGEDLTALPYLRFFEIEGGWCSRAGRTGEFGYHILLPRDQLPATQHDFEVAGAAFGLHPVGADLLEQAALENAVFDIRTFETASTELDPRTPPLTPIELQLQWRVEANKTFLGSEALAERRASGPRQRLTGFVSAEATKPGAEVSLKGRRVGQVFAAGISPLLGICFGSVLLDIAVAWPWLDMEVDGRTLRTVAAPALRNRSLYVNPAHHSFLRGEPPEAPDWLDPEARL